MNNVDTDETLTCYEFAFGKNRKKWREKDSNLFSAKMIMKTLILYASSF